MVDPALLSVSRTYPVTVEQAFDGVLAIPLVQLFDRRYGLIPRIRSTEAQSDTWREVGQKRRVRLADGGSMLEELTGVDRPNSFAYTLTDLTGPLKPIASNIEGRWSFAPVGTGTRITWQWTLHPASALSARALPVFGWFWRGYATQALQRIEDLLLADR